MGSRLSYFTVDITPGIEEEMIRHKYGFTGVGIMIELFRKMLINGHFIRWNGEICGMYAEQWEYEELPDLVETMQSLELIDPEWMKKGIMTSAEVQKQIMFIKKKSAEALNFKYPAERILSENFGDFRKKAEKSGEKRKKAEKSGVEREREREIERNISGKRVELLYAQFTDSFGVDPTDQEKAELSRTRQTFGDEIALKAIEQAAKEYTGTGDRIALIDGIAAANL